MEFLRTDKSKVYFIVKRKIHMSAGGNMADMVNRFNNNLQLKLQQHIKYEKVKEAYCKVKVKYPKFIDRGNLSEKELEQLKKKLELS